MFGARMKGPLKPHAGGFYSDLLAHGYTSGSAANQVWLMARLSAWMAENGLEPRGLQPEDVDRFLAVRRAQGCRVGISRAAAAPLLAYLRRLGAVPEPPVTVPATTGPGGLLHEYRTYLIKERGLAASTVGTYVRVAGLVLCEIEDHDLKELTAAGVAAFLLKETRARRTGLAKEIATGTRALLRFLYAAGKIGVPLDQAVPAVANWSLAALPKAIEPTEVDRLLTNCDQTTPVGRRDSAIITVLVRLGLRAGEVAALRLSDIDWRRGEIVIHGKGSRAEPLPLPVDVGEAMVAWLAQGRPAASTPYVFTRVHAPHGSLTREGVSTVVRAACVRAGLPPFGAHRLRHTAATQMLRHGADLMEVGQGLRHRSLGTTAIYAKVDRPSLATLARPWPSGAL